MLNNIRLVRHGLKLLGCSVDSHHRLFLFVRQSRRHVIVKQDGRGILVLWLPYAVHSLPVLLQVPSAVEAGVAEVAGEWPLPSVDDDMSGELRAALLVFATYVADEALRRPRPVGVDDLAVSLQVAEASEAAAAEVTGVGSDLAVDHRVARQQ